MSPSPLRLVPTGLLALPGAAGAMALDAATGTLAAGDDRGEAGLWDRNGVRLGGWRLRGAVASADTDVVGGTPRAAFVSAAGEAVVVTGSRAPLQVALRPGDRVLLDRVAGGFFALSPAGGAVAVHDALGRVSRQFQVPGPVHAAVAVARTGGIATTTREGVFGRFTPWGALSWGGDYRRYTGGLAADPGGEMLIVCSLVHGAEVLHASSGGRLGALDVGRAVECASVSSTHAALGCSDGTVTLHDRSGRLLAQGRAGSKVVSIAVADGGALFVRLADGTVRAWAIEPDETPLPAGPAAAPHAWVTRRPLARSEAASRRPCVHVGSDGTTVAVAEPGRQVVVFGGDGARVAEAPYQGMLLALRVRDGEVLAVTTQELRRIRGGEGQEARRFAAEQVRAAWASGGDLFATVDEVGAVRLVDARTAADVVEFRMPQGEIVERIVATPLAAVVQTRSGAVRTVIAGGSREIVVRRGGETPRLVGATRQGPVLLVGSEVVACTWGGQQRWTHRPRSEALAVAALDDDRVAVVLGDALHILGRDGRGGTPAARPEGTLAAVAGGRAAAFAWLDGRRVTVARESGRALLTETFESAVRSVALSDGGGVAAVVLDGSVAIVRRTTLATAEIAAAPQGAAEPPVAAADPAGGGAKEA